MRIGATLFLLTSFAILVPADAAAATTICNATWHDAERDRDVPVRIRIPAGTARVPLILFSHGLGGSLESGAIWAEDWSNAGFAVINVQHPGSDSSILGAGMFQAMNAVQLIARAKDISFVIGYATTHPREGACDLARIDPGRIGMSGHSFGAVTTQAVSGEVYPGGTLGDSRIKAAIAFSPSPPTKGSAEDAFARIAIPFFSITGTKDSVAFSPFTAESRPKVYEAMKPGGKYLLIIKDAEHLNFGGQRGARWPISPVSTHVQAVVKEASTDFWRWTLMGDAAARERLDTLGKRIGPGDSFAYK